MDWIFLVKVLMLQILCAAGSKQMVLHGKIRLDRMPASLPHQSCLTVKLEDTSLADAPSELIAKRLFRGSDLKLTKGGIPYNMTFNKPKVNERNDYTISATLNVGWCASGGSKWIRNGDYLTTTSFPVKITGDKAVYEENFVMEHYGHFQPKVHHHKKDDPCINAPCMNSICRSFANGSYQCIEVAGMPCAMPQCMTVDGPEPICASNGKTYDNECLMFADSCKDGVQISLTKIHDGECYSKHTMLGGILFSTCIVLLTVLGFISIFWIWRRNRKMKIEQQFGDGTMKKVAPLGI